MRIPGYYTCDLCSILPKSIVIINIFYWKDLSLYIFLFFFPSFFSFLSFTLFLSSCLYSINLVPQVLTLILIPIPFLLYKIHKIYLYSLPSSLNHLKSRLYHHTLKFQFLFVEISDNIPVSPAIEKKNDNNNVRVFLTKFNSFGNYNIQYPNYNYPRYLDYDQVVFTYRFCRLSE